MKITIEFHTGKPKTDEGYSDTLLYINAKGKIIRGEYTCGEICGNECGEFCDDECYDRTPFEDCKGWVYCSEVESAFAKGEI